MDLIEAQRRSAQPTIPLTELQPKQTDVALKTPAKVEKTRPLPDDFYANVPCTD